MIQTQLIVSQHYSMNHRNKKVSVDDHWIITRRGDRYCLGKHQDKIYITESTESKVGRKVQREKHTAFE